MRFDVITLFPDLFGPFMSLGVTRRAFESRQVDVRLWPLRDFADDNYRRVDDRPYGGGPGMVMLVEPLTRALAAVRHDRAAQPSQHGAGAGGDSRGDTHDADDASDASDASDTATNAGTPAAAPAAPAAPADMRASVPVIHFSPTGRPIDQALLREMATGPGAVLLCGRYEGIDQRFLDRHVDLELSLGDFVLSGGELPALALLDGIARLQEGVLSDARSHQQDSFEDGLLDCPHYSRPERLATPDGESEVPPVLLSGHHADIQRWRREQSLAITARRRPDLITAARAAGRLTRADERFLASLVP